MGAPTITQKENRFYTKKKQTWRCYSALNLVNFKKEAVLGTSTCRSYTSGRCLVLPRSQCLTAIKRNRLTSRCQAIYIARYIFTPTRSMVGGLICHQPLNVLLSTKAYGCSIHPSAYYSKKSTQRSYDQVSLAREIQRSTFKLLSTYGKNYRGATRVFRQMQGKHA